MESIQLPPGGWLRFWPDFFEPAQADAHMAALSEGLAWSQQSIRMFGREVPQPRLTAFYGQGEIEYRYSGLTWRALPWSGALATLAVTVSEHAGQAFNSVLCNLYRDGQDSMGWHADDEPALGQNPVIASVSFGQSRRFDLKPKTKAKANAVSADDPVRLVLAHGSLLIMGGATQHHWVHQIPKTRKALEPRINLTFRWIDPS